MELPKPRSISEGRTYGNGTVSNSNLHLPPALSAAGKARWLHQRSICSSKQVTGRWQYVKCRCAAACSPLAERYKLGSLSKLECAPLPQTKVNQNPVLNRSTQNHVKNLEGGRSHVRLEPSSSRVLIVTQVGSLWFPVATTPSGYSQKRHQVFSEDHSMQDNPAVRLLTERKSGERLESRKSKVVKYCFRGSHRTQQPTIGAMQGH